MRRQDTAMTARRPAAATAAAVLAVWMTAALPGRGTTERVRVPVDTVGYAATPAQVEAVVTAAERMIAAGLPAADGTTGGAGSALTGAIVPHDDHAYAGPYAVAALRGIRAPLVVLFGVAHRARMIGLEGRLVFDDFDAWRGPYGDMPVSPLRERLIEALPEAMVLVSGEIHAAEHSLEALVPILQFPRFPRAPGRREILPILVTRQPGDSFERAVEATAAAMAAIFAGAGLEMGEDVAMVISADCVHYGDEGWGERDYAPFGTGRDGYDRAVAQDLDIARSTLTGPVTGERLRLFRERVERDDVEWPYRVTWCGVYSIPFGLAVLERLAALEGRPVPAGTLLGYGTSVEPGPLDVEGTGPGRTAPNTLHHWVGYVSVGYR